MPDTIYALATAPGKAGVAIVRISGPASGDVIAAFGAHLPEPKTFRLARLRDIDGRVLDEALVLYFPENASFTGEKVVELQCHGSMAVVKAVLAAIGRTGLARMAEPGEFTRRALMNTRLDLTQVQGLADLIDADTEIQRQHAMRVFEGELADTVESWRRDLTRARALLEATIDFADEDVPQDVRPEVKSLIRKVIGSLRKQLSGVGDVVRIRDGFNVAIIGAPNVGKSSLLNALTKSDAAIVSEVAGTTRDLIEVRLEVAGFQVNLIDTAGIRDTNDVIEKIGVERARERAKNADLRILLYDNSSDKDLSHMLMNSDIRVRSKADLHVCPEGLSIVTGQGIPELLAQIAEKAAAGSSNAGLVSRLRDQQAILGALGQLDCVLDTIDAIEVELLSSDIQASADRLSTIIGGVDVEAILDEVFSSFCLGK